MIGVIFYSPTFQSKNKTYLGIQTTSLSLLGDDLG